MRNEPTSTLPRTRGPWRRSLLLLSALTLLIPGCDRAAAGEGDAETGRLHFRMVTRFGFGGSMYFAPEFFFLQPDGRIYRDVPPQGFEAFDYEAMRAQEPGKTGTYAIDGGTMRVEWADGSTSEYRYEEGADGDFNLDGLFTGRVPAFPAGRTLDGTWTHLVAGGAAGQALSGSQTITLRPDGAFQESRFGTGWVAAPGASASAASASEGEGTYRLAGNTLTLTYGDGTTRRFSAFPFGEGEDGVAPEFLNVNGRMFSQQER